MSYRLNTSTSPPASPAAAPGSNFPTVDTTEKGSHKPEPAAPNAKGDGMLLFLRNKMLQLKADEITICRIAHVWAFGTDPDLTSDAAELRDHGFIPLYLRNYLKTMQ